MEEIRAKKGEGKGGLGNESGLGGSVRAHIRPEMIARGLGSLGNPPRARNRHEKIQKLIENSKNPKFRIFPGRRPGRSPIK